MRRKDREKDESFAFSVIDSAPFCTIGITDGGSVYTVPLSVVRDGRSLYFHSALEGRKVDMLRSGHSVSLTAVSECCVDQEGYTVRYRSAHADADVHEIADEREKAKALMLIIRRFAPDNTGMNPEKYIRAMADKTLVWRLDIISIAGKENRQAE